MSVEYFPELKDFKHKNRDKYGISNVTLVRDNNVLGGYSWRYTYYDKESERMRFISSYDLKKLRRNVESQGFDWVVTNMDRARETYKLNSRLLVSHENIRIRNKESKRVAEHTVSKCGVQYVYLNKTKGTVYWTYRDGKHKSITRKSLNVLRSVVESMGYEWIVKDKDLYESILDGE